MNVHGHKDGKMAVAMTKVFEKQAVRFDIRHMRHWVFSDLVFRQCSFERGGIICDDPSERVVIRGIELDRCKAYGGTLQGVILEDVLAKGPIRLGRDPITHACALKHVKIAGRIDTLWIHDLWNFDPDDPINGEFKDANAKYYESVDWALDISEAEFSGECDIRGVPWQLIRRDPETQVVVTRQKVEVMSYELERLDLDRTTYWETAIRMMMNRGEDGTVLVAPKRSKKFRDYLQGLHLLRQAGIAEPD